MQRSPRVLHSVVGFSMACPLLALRGWKQFQTDVLQHDETDQDRLREFFYEVCWRRVGWRYRDIVLI